MQSAPFRVTPWVGRLIAINAVMLLLSMTLFTSGALIDVLQFNPKDALVRPWTFVTYMFVHGGLLHLVGNMLLLFFFGSAIESRMGSRNFILYYLYCGIGAAVFALGLSGIMTVHPFIGASGAALGVALAFAMFWPDAEVIIFPIPLPITARTLVTVLIGLDIVLALVARNDGIAHLAHIGGVLFGFMYFRLRSLSNRRPAPPPRTVERVVMVQSGASEPDRHTPITPIHSRRRLETDPVAAEVDRVLDKISQQGIASLTPAERRFLDEVSKQKKRDLH